MEAAAAASKDVMTGAASDDTAVKAGMEQEKADSLEEANRIRNKWLKKGLSVYWNITKELKKDE